TIRQAKRAYQKAGATPRISAAEQRRIDRAAELQERAARIKAHNLRAKENKRKKAEKQERDREARRQMSVSEHTKNALITSQLSLGAFVIPGKKPSSGLDSETKLKSKNLEDHAWDDFCAEFDDSILEADCMEPPFATLLQSVAPVLEGCSGPPAPCQSPEPPAQHAQHPPIPTATLMPPPPRPPALPAKSPGFKPPTKPIAQPEPKAPQMPTCSGTEIDWACFLDSNTQVAREISDESEKEPQTHLREKNTAEPFPTPFVAVPTDFLNGICTQDLQYSSSPPLPPVDDVSKTGPACEGIIRAASTSFDEFEVGALSSQDLRGLDV
ncbi:MAG: hypothetical protein Q9183_006268, partial [Haloplaca sp. 2 TL-2023]